MYIDEKGQVAFYRKGPYTGENKGEIARQLSWEVAGGFYTQDDLGSDFQDFHVVLCLLDEHTPLEAQLVKLGDAPPKQPTPAPRRSWVPEIQVQRHE